MCGIIGYVGAKRAAPLLLSGLRRLEYRGYDSTGIALAAAGRLSVHKAAGKLSRLEQVLPKRLAGKTGIGHTRWATHGAPSDVNAHPHLSADGTIAVVHNGIIENGAAIRARLESEGIEFASDTDTEALAHLIANMPGQSLGERVRAALAQTHGTYGLLVSSSDAPDELVAARNGSPVIMGVGDREMFVASDLGALVQHVTQVVHLDDGEVATIDARGFETTTLDNQPTAKQPAALQATYSDYDRGDHAHYMRKEILDQPEAVARALSGRLDHRFNTAHLGGLNLDARELLSIRRIKLLGCGSAYYAGQVGAHLIESFARIPADAEPAAEFRYRNPVIEQDTLYVAISQSGETLDTLMAVQEVRRRGGRVLGVVNVVGSSIAREVDGGVYIHAGPEVSVASTKAYTSTVVALTLLALHVGRIRDLSPERGRTIIRTLETLPESLSEVLDNEDYIRDLAVRYAHSSNAFFIGRALGYPIALEGAQKLKEISYIHAEAYPASELKHGPLALVTGETPTVVVLPADGLLDKAVGSIEEICARGGPVIAVGSHDARIEALASAYIRTPEVLAELSPAVIGVVLQLLAYHAAVHLERDIDQPRNLAKSVTVE